MTAFRLPLPLPACALSSNRDIINQWPALMAIPKLFKATCSLGHLSIISLLHLFYFRSKLFTICVLSSDILSSNIPSSNIILQLYLELAESVFTLSTSSPSTLCEFTLYPVFAVYLIYIQLLAWLVPPLHIKAPFKNQHDWQVSFIKNHTVV